MGHAKGYNKIVSKKCLGSQSGAYARRFPKEESVQAGALLLLLAPCLSIFQVCLLSDIVCSCKSSIEML